MSNEQTDKTDTKGTETNPTVENTDKPISEYDKALELVKRREEASKVELEILSRKEKLATAEILRTGMSGQNGGHVETVPAKEETPKEYSARIEKEISEGKHND